jgi:nitroreductase
MNSFLELAKTRRSIRSFDPRPVKREDLEKCVEAARYAPSACNSQEWKFIIIDDPEKKKLISEKVITGPGEMNSFAKNSAAFIAIVSEALQLPAWIGSKLCRTDYRSIDIGIACQTLVLQAHDLGIGTCILGWFNEKNLKKILSVPGMKKTELLIAMGYHAGGELREKQLKDKDEVMSYNRY